MDGKVELALNFRDLVLQARDTESQELEAAKAQRANIFGAKLIIEGLWLYGWDYKELSECRGQIMMALFKHIDKSELARGKVKARREGIGKF